MNGTAYCHKEKFPCNINVVAGYTHDPAKSLVQSSQNMSQKSDPFAWMFCESYLLEIV